MKYFLLILLIFTIHGVVYASDVNDLLTKVDTYRVLNFQSYPYSIWNNVCWKFPVLGVRDVSGHFIVAGDYLVEQQFVSKEMNNFPHKTFKDLIAKHDPNKVFPKWRMPPKVNVIAVIYDLDGEYLGSIHFDSNYDSFSIFSDTDYHFRFGNGAGDQHVSTLIDSLIENISNH